MKLETATKGSYPRTRSIGQLIRELGRVDPRILVLVSDVKNLHCVARLEEAYISSRYLPYRYTIEEVKDIGRFVLEVFKLIVDSI
jgi:HEPN domain-containing protein